MAPKHENSERLLIFPSELGWMAVAMGNDGVQRLTFGHRNQTDAKKAIALSFGDHACSARFHAEREDEGVVLRLQNYAAGQRETFLDIPVDLGAMSEFRRKVLELCRRIPYGEAVSYADLAAQAGSPRAARAVGNCMAANPIPLIIPCHRVICSDGRIGVYSATGGTAMKRRLLAMETSAEQ